MKYLSYLIMKMWSSESSSLVFLIYEKFIEKEERRGRGALVQSTLLICRQLSQNPLVSLMYANSNVRLN
jgi:hypothetical protein